MAVRFAHAFAIENPNITADMVEVSEFPYFVQRYSIQGVPKIVIDEKTFIDGAVPEQVLLEKVLEAASKQK